MPHQKGAAVFIFVLCVCDVIGRLYIAMMSRRIREKKRAWPVCLTIIIQCARRRTSQVERCVDDTWFVVVGAAYIL